jgi:hypothetical protein
VLKIKEKTQRVVSRAVIDKEEGEIAAGLARQGGKAGGQKPRAVPVWDNDSYGARQVAHAGLPRAAAA